MGHLECRTGADSVNLGYDTGQISGFVAMPDFLRRFADEPGPAFSNGREGTIVGLLSIGTLIGVLVAGPIADKLGRKLAIVTWCVVFIIGITIQIATFYSWVQFAIGKRYICYQALMT